jgi:hypothetical protein
VFGKTLFLTNLASRISTESGDARNGAYLLPAESRSCRAGSVATPSLYLAVSKITDEPHAGSF